ncbi:MAG: hypothetical protein A2Z14_06490 [Chloroflexi bacterium RBG_16_48_8]|nr:MAG: hypothetical protein A2Z14_06490 [Chloroflexi bacterium RBG_16_48_8]
MSAKHDLSLIRRAILIFLVLPFSLTSCKSTSGTVTATQLKDAAPTLPQPTEVKPPEPTAIPPTTTPEPTQVPTEETGPVALPAEPQHVEFQAEDGKNLVGYYYPAGVNPAPAVILMHWAGGDQRDWLAIAPWLQNRPEELATFPGWEAGIGAECREQLMGPWLDPSWFPPALKDVSFAIFTFDFRDFCESEAGLENPEGWLLDAVAAFKTVSGLPGVDPDQIVAIGASIGADAAPDGCSEFIVGGGVCLGGFSLSPGSYLGIPYDEVVTQLDEEEIPVWCLAAKGDPPSAFTCLSASGEHYQTTMYEGEEHGMMLIKPELVPNPLALILEFLEEAFGIETE